MAFVNQHRPNDFTPVVAAMELADHVIKITDNVNKFPDYVKKERTNPDGTVTMVLIQRQDSLTNWVRDQAKEIFILAYTANRIDLRKQPYRKRERLEKQVMAVALCDEHFAAIQLCRMHFHLSAKKVKHWGTLTKTVKDTISAWHESDKDRYKSI